MFPIYTWMCTPAHLYPFSSPALNEKAHFHMLMAVISHYHWPSDINIEFFFVHDMNYANHRVRKLWNNENGIIMLLIAVFAVTARQTTSNCALKIEFLITLPHCYDIALLYYLTGNRKSLIKTIYACSRWRFSVWCVEWHFPRWLPYCHLPMCMWPRKS